MSQTKEKQIGELALFKGCRPSELRWMAGVADVVDVPAGRTLATEGQTVKEFVVLMSGVATASDGDGSISLAPGSFFGETGLVSRRPHAQTIKTGTPARLLVFEARAFRGMLDRVPAVARNLLTDMVVRLRTIDQEPRSLRAVS